MLHFLSKLRSQPSAFSYRNVCCRIHVYVFVSSKADGEELANPCCQSNPLALVIASSLDAMNGVDLRKDRVKVAQIDQQLIGRGGDGQQEAHGRHPDAEAHPRGLFTALGRDCRLRGLLNFSLGELDHTSRGCFIHLGVISSRVLVPLDMLSHLWEQVCAGLLSGKNIRNMSSI